MNNLMNKIILRIDKIIDDQLKEIVENTQFQSLRSRWLGLLYLLELGKDKTNVKIKLLNVSLDELSSDLNRHADIESSSFFNKVYHQEFGHAGGEPFGVLVGDYEINIHNSSRKDLHLLKQLAEIGNISFSPITLAISPNSFGYDNFLQYNHMMDLKQVLSHRDYSIWQKIRQENFSKFIALSMPNVLLNDFANSVFKSSYLYSGEIWHWCHAGFSIAAVMMNNFNETNWFCDLTGIDNESISAGKIPALSPTAFNDYATIKTYRPLSEFVICEHQEKKFSDLGFIPVCQLSNHQAYFLSMRSICSNQENDDISNSLSYLLCVCRFAHYLKIIGRNIIGRYTEPKQCQHELKQWLHKYVASNSDLPESLRYQFPLRKAEITISEQEGYQDKYICKIWLSPNLRVNQSVATILLTTEI